MKKNANQLMEKTAVSIPKYTKPSLVLIMPFSPSTDCRSFSRLCSGLERERCGERGTELLIAANFRRVWWSLIYRKAHRASWEMRIGKARMASRDMPLPIVDLYLSRISCFRRPPCCVDVKPFGRAFSTACRVCSPSAPRLEHWRCLSIYFHPSSTSTRPHRVCQLLNCVVGCVARSWSSLSSRARAFSHSRQRHFFRTARVTKTLPSFW